MAANKFRFPSGVSLIEVMITIVVLSIGVIAASGYRYHSTLDITRADAQTAAAGIGSAGYSVESTGKSGGVQKTIAASLPLMGPFEYPVFTDSHVWLASSTTVDQVQYRCKHAYSGRRHQQHRVGGD